MCLAIDGQTFCDVLKAAPLLEGKSLERVEHDLEEGKHEYTEATVELLARTCNLPVEEYRDRLMRIRSDNLMRELNWLESWLNDKFHAYFDRPQGCKEYVAGTVSVLPSVPGVTPQAYERFRQRLTHKRYRHFCARIDGGFLLSELARYPERDEWVARAGRDLKTAKQLTRYCQNLLIKQAVPPVGIYYPSGQLDLLARSYFKWFYEKSRREASHPVSLFLTISEKQETARQLAEFRNLERTKPRGKHRQGRAMWRAHQRRLLAEWADWKSSLREKYFHDIARLCLQQVPAQASALPVAA